MTFEEFWKDLEKEDEAFITARKQSEEIVKFINENCRYCDCDSSYDDIIEDCGECPLLQQVLKRNVK